MSFKLRFWGVRGSYPVSSSVKGFDIGGNTTCLEVEIGDKTIIFDAGTGIIKLGKYFAKKMRENKIRNGELLLFFTHYHQDHTQGLPFFVPLYMPSVKIHFLGPKIGGGDVFSNLEYSMNPPFFPVMFDETLSKKEFFNIQTDDVVKISAESEKATPSIGEKYIEMAKEPEPDKIRILCTKNYIHPKDGSFFYSIEYKNKKVVFATDIEGYVGGDQRLIAVSKNADYLIHDAQYSPDVYLNQNFTTQGYGHSMPSIAADVAKQANVKNLILTHHDPESDDKKVKAIEAMAQELFKNSFYSYEIMEVDVLKNKVSKFEL